MALDLKGDARNFIVKPACAAAVAGVATALWRPGSTAIIPGSDKTMALPLLAAGAAFLAVEATGLVEKYLFPHVPVINALEAPAHTALNVATGAGVGMVVENYMSPGIVGGADQIPLTEFAIMAGGWELGSTYLCDEWVIPMYNKWMAHM